MTTNHRSDLVDIPGVIIRETEKAYCFTTGGKEAWLPKSQCEWDDDAETMTMPERLATEKGLI